MMTQENIHPKDGDGATSQGSVGAARLRALTPFPWAPHDTQDSRGWTVQDARGETVAMFPRLSVPTPDAARFVAAAVNAYMGAAPRPTDGTEAEPSSLVEEMLEFLRVIDNTEAVLIGGDSLREQARALLAKAERKG
jgi:hypothetical protein